jgi:RNA polymerase sigma factor (sigma-70 family)
MNKRENRLKADNTAIGGAGDRFPRTQWSAIVALRSRQSQERTRGLETIIASYWKPVYKHIRLKWRKDNEDAKDLTQGFFTKALEKDFFSGYDPKKARFRTFLRTCLDGFVANENKAAGRLKRGGGAQLLSLDFAGAEGELARLETSHDANLDDHFDKEWMRALFDMAIHALEKECLARGKELHFKIFTRYDLADEPENKPSYAQLAEEFGLADTEVTNYLAFARRELRRILLGHLRQLTATDEEFRDEARHLFGVNVP